MSLPKGVIPYLKGLLCVFENANCFSLAKVSDCSHDSLTRILNIEKFFWQTLLKNFTLRIFDKLCDGFLIIDDTVISKRFAKKIENLAFIFDSKIGRSILGLNIVMIAWSNGNITIPLALRIYQSDNGKTKIDLAVELLKYARFLGIKPKYVSFDAWYAADKVLKTIAQFKWKFITQIKNNRKLIGVPLKEIARNPYWIIEGRLTGGLKVIVVRHGKKYFATNNLSLSKQEILSGYKGRWLVETVFRVLHYKLGIDQCEARSLKAQMAHFHLCLMAYVLLEKEKFITGKTVYRIKRNCSFNFKLADNLINKLIFQGA